MTKREALKRAGKFVTIVQNGSSWTVCGPRCADDPSGFVGEDSFETFRKAQISAAALKAKIALHFLGKYSPERDFDVEEAANCIQDRRTTASAMLDYALIPSAA